MLDPARSVHRYQARRSFFGSSCERIGSAAWRNALEGFVFEMHAIKQNLQNEDSILHGVHVFNCRSGRLYLEISARGRPFSSRRDGGSADLRLAALRMAISRRSGQVSA